MYFVIAMETAILEIKTFSAVTRSRPIAAVVFFNLPDFLPFNESVDEEGADGDQEDSEENKLANFIKYIQETKVRSA